MIDHSIQRLFLSTILSDFNPKVDLAFGPHCFVGRESIYSGWKDLKFFEPFPTDDLLEKNERELGNLINYLLPSLTGKLNYRHNVSYSNDFWRILIFPWLIELSQKTWVSYSRLKLLIDKYGNNSLEVQIYGQKPRWTFLNTAEFFSTMLSDYDFHWWLDSELLKVIAPRGWVLKIPEEQSKIELDRVIDSPKKPSNSVRDRLVQYIKRRLGYTDVLGLKWAGLVFALYLNIAPKNPVFHSFRPPSNYNPEVFFPSDFLLILNGLIEKTMPQSLGENFAVLEEKARALPICPGRWRLGTLNLWDDNEKTITALAVEGGEKRLVFQHGGEYGMINYNMMFNEMEGRLCKFISWGWENPRLKNVVPLPSPFHSRIVNSHNRKNDNIIYVSGGIRILLSRIHWAHRVNAPISYAKETLNFIECLNVNIRNHTQFRPYTRTANDIETSEMVLERFPDMKLIEGDLDSQLLKCRLVVLYSYSTVMNFCLAANVPTIIHVVPERMRVYDSARKLFTPLVSCGVLHENPSSAANYLNKIWPEVESWWYGKDVQSARENWVKNYCNTEKYWMLSWFKELKKIKKESVKLV